MRVQAQYDIAAAALDMDAAELKRILESAAPEALQSAEATLWHKVFRHYFHDGMEECRHCGLPRANRIHDMSPLPIHAVPSPQLRSQEKT